jgi:plasmid stability protein
MPTQSVTLALPDPLYERLRERAEQTRRSLEEEALEVLATAVPVDGALPPEVAQAIESLDVLDDDVLWDAARSRLSADVCNELESLHLKQRRDGLADAETRQLAALVRQYEQHMLVRARAVALLKERGHDVSELLAS